MALTGLGTQFNADSNSLTAQTEAARNAELLEQSQWQAGYDLQQQQFEQSKQSSLFEQMYALLLKKKISKSQFESATGIDLR